MTNKQIYRDLEELENFSLELRSDSSSGNFSDNFNNDKIIIEDKNEIDNMSSSTIVKSLKTSTLLLNKESRKWISDQMVTNCSDCKIEFNFLIRKHHCRICGNIFCNNCACYFKEIPTTWNHNNYEGRQRLCFDCSTQVQKLNELDNMIKVFCIVVPNIETLYNMGKVSHLWNNLSSYFMGKIRNIQYKIINDPFTKIERDLLWVNRNYWIGHNNWMVVFLQSLKYDDFFFQEHKMNDFIAFVDSIGNLSNISCSKLLCTKNCSPLLQGHHAIILFEHSINKPVPSEYNLLIYKILNNINHNELIHYLPYLVSKIIYQDINYEFTIGNLLIGISLDNLDFAMELYWNLLYQYRLSPNNEYYKYYLNKFEHNIKGNKKIYEKLTLSHNFVKILEMIPDKSDIFTVKNYFRNLSVNNLILPFKPHFYINKIYCHLIDIKNSATAPLLLPIKFINNQINNYDSNSFNDETDIKILYKFENVKKDYIIIKAIRLMKFLLKKYDNIDFEIVDYNVLPLNSNNGIIEIVPNCHTVYEIKERMNFKIWNYIEEQNDDCDVGLLKTKFMKTLATYCVITYLFGVGDRHLDNIMITDDGRLFHIDFGFILGNDPKPISRPKIRITEDMVDALGGYESKYYNEFIVLCNKMFHCLRCHMNLFISLFTIICENREDLEHMRKLLQSRFMPSESKKNAIIQLQSEIYRSTKNNNYIDNYTQKTFDYLHYHNRENTINHVIDNAKKTTDNMIDKTQQIGNKVSNLISSWWNKK